MNRYRVFGGVARLGMGQVLELAGAQIKSRVHALELPEGYVTAAKDVKSKMPDFKQAVVKAKAQLEFKIGEVIGLPDMPPNLIGILEPLDPPKTPNDERAADKALQIKNPEAHKRKTAAVARSKAAEKASRTKHK